jgi:hypothetical protein
MVSGKGLDMAEIQDDDFKKKNLVSLFVKVYRRLIEQKIFTFLQIEREGVSPYAGVGCNQFVCGMFVRKDGRVQACAGNESEKFRYAKDIRHDDLRSVWVNCLGYKLRKELIETGKITTTQPCYAKTEGLFISKGSIPKDFYQTVLEKLR